MKYSMIVLVGMALGACSTVPSRQVEGALGAQKREQPQATLDCIYARSVYDWKALDDRNLVVWAPSRRKPYHLELDRRCSGLRFADSLAFNDRNDGRICAYGGDSIVIPGSFPERCSIAAIHPLEPQQLEHLLLRFGAQRALPEDPDEEAAGEGPG